MTAVGELPGLVGSVANKGVFKDVGESLCEGRVKDDEVHRELGSAPERPQPLIDWLGLQHCDEESET